MMMGSKTALFFCSLSSYLFYTQSFQSFFRHRTCCVGHRAGNTGWYSHLVVGHRCRRSYGCWGHSSTLLWDKDNEFNTNSTSIENCWVKTTVKSLEAEINSWGQKKNPWWTHKSLGHVIWPQLKFANKREKASTAVNKTPMQGFLHLP